MIRHSRLRACAICGAVLGAVAVLIALERVAVQVFEDDMLTIVLIGTIGVFLASILSPLLQTGPRNRR